MTKVTMLRKYLRYNALHVEANRLPMLSNLKKKILLDRHMIVYVFVHQYTHTRNLYSLIMQRRANERQIARTLARLYVFQFVHMHVKRNNERRET